MNVRVAAFVSVLVMGCDPVMGVRGEVSSVPRSELGRGVVYDSERPVSDAEIFLVCTATPRKIATSGEDGTFSFVTVGWLSPKCSVEIRAVGYHAERISLKNLCVHHDLGECHWANVSAELVPIAARTGGAAEAVAKPVQQLEFSATTPKLEVFDRGDQKFGLVEYVPLGTAPGTSAIAAGTHRFAATLGGRHLVEATDDVIVSGPTRVELEYEDRASLRTWKRIAFFTGLVVGPVIAAVGLEAQGAARPILIGTGIVIGVSGIVFGMDVNETTDRLRARVTPSSETRPAAAATSPDR
jgi:hypothetical protein